MSEYFVTLCDFHDCPNKVFFRGFGRAVCQRHYPTMMANIYRLTVSSNTSSLQRQEKTVDLTEQLELCLEVEEDKSCPR
jgi:hypothetical protein